MADGELEGNTLTVYAYVAKEGKPVGTRDVTRGANLSSPSVAHRHLQKLEALGLLEKNAYGDYMLKEKANVNGYVWVGRSLVPRLMFYSFFFMGALGSEITIVLVSYLTGAFAIETSFLFLTGMTAIAMILFFVEAVSLQRKVNQKRHKDSVEKKEEDSRSRLNLLCDLKPCSVKLIFSCTRLVGQALLWIRQKLQGTHWNVC